MEAAVPNEELKDALNEFSRNPQSKLPPLLEEFLCQIACTGQSLYPWPLIRPLILCRMESALADLGAADLPPLVLPSASPASCSSTPCGSLSSDQNSSSQQQKLVEIRDRVVERVAGFVAAPFTIQRLCELVVSPREHYKRADKFLRGLERTVMVVSSVTPSGVRISDELQFLADQNAVETPASNGSSPASSTCSGRSSLVAPGGPGGQTPRSRRSSAGGFGGLSPSSSMSSVTPNGGLLCSPGGTLGSLEMPPPGLAVGALSPNRPSQALSPQWRHGAASPGSGSGGDSPSYDAAEFKTPGGGRCTTPPLPLHPVPAVLHPLNGAMNLDRFPPDTDMMQEADSSDIEMETGEVQPFSSAESLEREEEEVQEPEMEVQEVQEEAVQEMQEVQEVQEEAVQEVQEVNISVDNETGEQL